VDLGGLDHAIGVDDEGAAQREAFLGPYRGWDAPEAIERGALIPKLLPPKAAR
jgi:hypothetical protein